MFDKQQQERMTENSEVEQFVKILSLNYGRKYANRSDLSKLSYEKLYCFWLIKIEMVVILQILLLILSVINGQIYLNMIMLQYLLN